MKLADSSPRVGDWVIAVGNPFGLGGTVTAGIVSARGRDIGAGPYDDFIQIDAPVNKGNSGGPTFDVDGNVIGVNTAIFSPSGGSVGIAFAIPADTVKSVVAQLRDKGVVTRGWIGVQIQSITPDLADSMGLKQATGALVSEPQTDSPAAKAGIQSGDVITSVDDAPIHDARELARKIGTMAPGTTRQARHDSPRPGQNRDADARHLAERRSRPRTTPNQREVPDSEMPKLGLSLAPGEQGFGRGRQRRRGHGGRAKAALPPITASRSATLFSTWAASRCRRRPTSARALPMHVRTGKHTVLFRVKSGDGTKFVALPLGNA